MTASRAFNSAKRLILNASAVSAAIAAATWRVLNESIISIPHVAGRWRVLNPSAACVAVAKSHVLNVWAAWIAFVTGRRQVLRASAIVRTFAAARRRILAVTAVSLAFVAARWPVLGASAVSLALAAAKCPVLGGSVVSLAVAARRHVLSLTCTALLLTVSASLVGFPAPLALVVWVAASLLSLGMVRAVEPFVLRRLGCRPPNRLECERVEPALQPVFKAADVELQVLDVAEPWLGRGLRSLVVTRALLDVLDDRALVGLLIQAMQPVRSTSLPGELVVWLGNLPLLGAWCVDRWLIQVGRMLAVAVGSCLVVPMLLFPVGFTRWVGRLFGTGIAALLGSALLSGGLAGPGLGLLLAWALVPCLRALLDWERRRTETCADDASFEAGVGWQLLEALETLAWTAGSPTPAGLLGLLARPSMPVTDRADRLWQALAQS